MNNRTKRNALLRELMNGAPPARRLHLHRELLQPVEVAMRRAGPDRGRVVRTQSREVYGFVPRRPSRAPQLLGLLMAALLVVSLVVLLCAR